MRFRGLVALLVAGALLAIASPALAAVVHNGDFETGTLSGWTVANRAGGSGNWYAYSAASPPPGQCAQPPFGPPVSPPQGKYAATTSQGGPGSHVLYQDITLEPNATHTLSFTLYYKNAFIAFSDPNTLDYTIDTPNQQYRVDLLKPSADPFSVASSDVLQNLFRTTTPGSPNTLGPTKMTFDLTPFAGQTVRLRFAEVDNRDCLLASVDDVAVKSNFPPTAKDDSYKTKQGHTLAVHPPGVLKNDSDPDHEPLSAQLVKGPTHGTLTLRPNGSFRYTPKPGFSGTDTFKYRATDPSGTSNVATVRIRVIPTPPPQPRRCQGHGTRARVHQRQHLHTGAGDQGAVVQQNAC